VRNVMVRKVVGFYNVEDKRERMLCDLDFSLNKILHSAT
jgi:hypothetical protein